MVAAEGGDRPSGDLGLSVGPSAVNGKRGGYYATIWRKGRRPVAWIYDGGAEADAASAPDAPTPADQGPVGERSKPRPPRLWRRAAAEAAGQGGEPSTRGRPTAPPCPSDALAARAPGGNRDLALDRRPDRPAPAAHGLGMRGGGASAAGDFVWTHGDGRDGPSPSDAPSTRTICMSGKGAPKGGV
jgi:hypothetical protein